PPAATTVSTPRAIAASTSRAPSPGSQVTRTSIATPRPRSAPTASRRASSPADLPLMTSSQRGAPFMDADRRRARSGARAAAGAVDLAAHARDDRGVVRLAEDGRPGHEGVGARRRDSGDVVRLHPAVDLQPHRAPAGVDALAHAA